MSQQRIMKILLKLGKNDWISTTKLSKLLKVNRSAVTSNLKKMKTYNEIESRILKIKTKQHQSTSFEHRLTLRGRQQW